MLFINKVMCIESTCQFLSSDGSTRWAKLSPFQPRRGTSSLTSFIFLSSSATCVMTPKFNAKICSKVVFPAPPVGKPTTPRAFAALMSIERLLMAVGVESFKLGRCLRSEAEHFVHSGGCTSWRTDRVEWRHHLSRRGYRGWLCIFGAELAIPEKDILLVNHRGW